SAAYEWLESGGLIQGAVGRGSFVLARPESAEQSIDWSRALTPSAFSTSGSPAPNAIDFSSSRPSETLFPLDEFRHCCAEVLVSRELQSLLQLGSPLGHLPLRRWLFQRAKQQGVAGEN